MIPPPGGAIPVRTVRMFECGCRIIDHGPGSPQRVLMCNIMPDAERAFDDPSRREDGTGQWERHLTVTRLSEIAAELERTTPKYARAIIGTCVRCNTKYGFWAKDESEYAICAVCGQIQTGLARNPFDFQLTMVTEPGPVSEDADVSFYFACGCRMHVGAWVDNDASWREEAVCTPCGQDHARALVAQLGQPTILGSRVSWVRMLGKIGAEGV